MRAPLSWIFKRTKKRIPALCIMVAASVLSALLGVMFALGTRNVIDAAVSGSKEAFLHASLMQGAIILGILICVTIHRHLYDKLSAVLDRDWKQSLLHGLLHGEYEEVSKYHSAELINRLTNDVRTIDDGLLTSLPNVAAMVTRLVAAVAVMLSMEPWFTLVVLAAGIVVVLVTGIMRRHLKDLHKKVSEHDGRVAGFLQETLEKLLMVQAMDLSPEMERRSDLLMEARYKMQLKRKNVSLFANTSVSVMSYGAGFVALVWCAFKMLNGLMTFGALTAVTQLVSQLQGPFVNLSAVIPKYIAMTAAAERLMELEDISSEPEPGCDVEAMYSDMLVIAGENLAFSYDRDIVMSGASFEVPKGAFAVVTGPSGIGKSTLLKLMLGIFKPESGLLYIRCGEKQLTLDRTTRRLFSYVPQGNLLFSGTIRENLLVAKPNATECEIQQAVFVSAMDEFLGNLPCGLDTVLGESGTGLSEGQAQRVAIARAIVGGAPILLLDECTSALDVQTEQTVLKRISELQNRTCIAVTHRSAAIEICDYNLIMDNGKICVTKK